MVLVMVCVHSAHGQAPGSLLLRGDVEAGFVYHDLNRELTRDSRTVDFVDQEWSVLVRMGVTESMSASVELATALGGADVGDYSYIIGAAIQTRMWSHGSTQATTSIAYTQKLFVYRESAGADWLVKSLDWNAFLEQAFSCAGVPLTAWGGPTLSHLSVQPQAPGDEKWLDASQMLGGIVGARALFVDHISLTAQATWISAFESSLFVGYRF
jgi:hypothetical protein